MSTHQQQRYFSLWPGGRGSPSLAWITMEGNHHTSSNHPHARAPASSQGLPRAISFATDTRWGYKSENRGQTRREGESDQGGLDAGNETENTKQRIWHWAPGRLGFPGGSDGKESTCQCRKPGSIPGAGRSPGEGNGDPLQCSCLENSVDREGWRAPVHEITVGHK